MTNRPHGTLYIGVTGDLAKRIWDHREGAVPGFTARYGLDRLVHAESHEELQAARQREVTLKTWRRAWKVRLIESANPSWDDLFDKIA